MSLTDAWYETLKGKLKYKKYKEVKIIKEEKYKYPFKEKVKDLYEEKKEKYKGYLDAYKEKYYVAKCCCCG